MTKILTLPGVPTTPPQPTGRKFVTLKVVQAAQMIAMAADLLGDAATLLADTRNSPHTSAAAQDTARLANNALELAAQMGAVLGQVAGVETSKE